jgi:hypothetical protein
MRTQIACTGGDEDTSVQKQSLWLRKTRFLDVIRRTRDAIPERTGGAGRIGTSLPRTLIPRSTTIFLSLRDDGGTCFYGLADTFGGVVSGDNVASILTRHDKSWKAYAENLPRTGYVEDGGDPHGLYVKRHNPFAYLKSVVEPASGLSQRENIVPFKQFGPDLKDNKLPNYSFVVPNLVNDAHDNPKTRRLRDAAMKESLRVADDWLKKNIKPLLDSESFQKDLPHHCV